MSWILSLGGSWQRAVSAELADPSKTLREQVLGGSLAGSLAGLLRRGKGRDRARVTVGGPHLGRVGQPGFLAGLRVTFEQRHRSAPVVVDGMLGGHQIGDGGHLPICPWRPGRQHPFLKVFLGLVDGLDDGGPILQVGTAGDGEIDALGDGFPGRLPVCAHGAQTASLRGAAPRARDGLPGECRRLLLQLPSRSRGVLPFLFEAGTLQRIRPVLGSLAGVLAHAGLENRSPVLGGHIGYFGGDFSGDDPPDRTTVGEADLAGLAGRICVQAMSAVTRLKRALISPGQPAT